MKNYTKDELKKIYAARREKLFAFMKENKITAAVFEDTEGRRDLSVRYFTGHPSDALWICSSDGKNKQKSLPDFPNQAGIFMHILPSF